MYQLFSQLLEFFYPSLCTVCEVRITVSHALCTDCWNKLEFLPTNADTWSDEANCQGEQIHYNNAYSAVAFNEVARKLIHDLKYQDRTYIAHTVARLMVLTMLNLKLQPDLLIPVPMHRSRLRGRRYNQAALIARKLGSLVKVLCLVDALFKVRNTPSQTTLDFHHRLVNNAGAFQVVPKRYSLLKGKRILLVDDVLTTGATVNECAKALKQAGTCRVDILTFAKN